MFEVPEWAANKVVYQIFPSRFAATEPVDKELWYKAPITPMDDLHGNLRESSNIWMIFRIWESMCCI